jgi:DNA-binding MarR family transcriptional regulator
MNKKIKELTNQNYAIPILSTIYKSHKTGILTKDIIKNTIISKFGKNYKIPRSSAYENIDKLEARGLIKYIEQKPIIKGRRPFLWFITDAGIMELNRAMGEE